MWECSCAMCEGVMSPTEPWRPVLRTGPTRTSACCCCPTRRAPARGRPPPRRGTWTQSSMRGRLGGTSLGGGSSSGGRAGSLVEGCWLWCISTARVRFGPSWGVSSARLSCWFCSILLTDQRTACVAQTGGPYGKPSVPQFAVNAFWPSSRVPEHVPVSSMRAGTRSSALKLRSVSEHVLGCISARVLLTC